jgi:hypothetical protein
MTEPAKDKWETYSNEMRKALKSSVNDGHSSVSFSGKTEKEALMLFSTPQSPFQSAVYGDGDWNKVPTCYVLSDEISEHALSLR